MEKTLEQKAQAIQDELKGLKNENSTLKGEFKTLKDANVASETKHTGEVKKLDDALNAMSDEVKTLKDINKVSNEAKTLGDALYDLAKKDGAFEVLGKDIASKKTKEGSMEIKATVLSTALTGNRQRSKLEAGIDKPIERQPFMREILPNVPLAKNEPVITWTERTAHVDGSGSVAEGDAAGESSSTWEEKTRSVVTLGVHFKYSVKAFNNVPQLIEDLRMDVIGDVDRLIDTQCLTGDGTGQNFYGVYNDATAFNATTVGKVKNVANPNLADLIKCAALQVQLSNRVPSHVIVNPINMSDLELSKNSDGDYILPPFMTADKTMISGLRVVSNTGMAVDKMMVLDRTSVRLYIQDDMQLQVWDQNEDDAKKRLKTVTLWFDGQVRVRENDKAGIVKVDSIATSLAAIKEA